MKYKIWLLLLNVSSVVKIQLLQKYKNEKNIYNNFCDINFKEYPTRFKITDYKRETSLKKAEELINWMKLNKVGFVSYNEIQFPEKLRLIAEPPYGFFYKGDLALLHNKIVAIVGARLCTSYGIEVTKLLTKELISYNITIISGGAKGIDSVAHTIALNNSGKTIVVLGSGIDVMYPYQNRMLFKKVEEEGLIISEYLPGTEPNKYNFPWRNRIISALSSVVIVTEASEKSGSLITASYAGDQGRTIIAVPGSVFSKSSYGCNKLIHDGVLCFSSVEDVLCPLGINSFEKIRKTSPIKEKILKLINEEPTHIDEIVNKSLVDRELLFNVLFEMQNENEIISLPGNYYAKII